MLLIEGLRQIRETLRTVDRVPWSEMSPPLLSGWLVSEAGGQQTVALEAYRIGPMHRVSLAKWDAALVREAGNWRFLSIRRVPPPEPAAPPQ